MCVSSPNGFVSLQYDDRTVVTAGSEQVMGVYLAGKFGVLPEWLPAKAWESFRNDHLVIATGAAEIQRTIMPLMEHSPPLFKVPFLAVAPLWQDTDCLAMGVRLDDRLAIHAWLAAKDTDAAVRARGTVEALKPLLQATAKNARASFEAAQQPNPLALGLLDLADRLLDNLKFQQEGNAVQLATSAEFNKAMLGTLAPPIMAAAQRTQSQNNLKYLMLAMHNYVDAKRHFPPAVLYGPDGKTPYSWRVEVLPMLGHQDLYAQYHFDEPWDGPNNRKLLDKMPAEFRSPQDPADSKNSSYFPLVGPGAIFDATKPSESESGGGGLGGGRGGGGPGGRRTAFDGTKGARIEDITDGTSYTIMLVEAKREIPWTKPEDIPYDPDKPLPQLGGYFEGGFHVAMADGSVHFLSSNVSEKVLRALITRAGREPVKIEDAIPKPDAGNATKSPASAAVDPFDPSRASDRPVTSAPVVVAPQKPAEVEEPKGATAHDARSRRRTGRQTGGRGEGALCGHREARERGPRGGGRLCYRCGRLGAP